MIFILINAIKKVNVLPATKSILRYPGGKSQLSGFVKNLLKLNCINHPIYCEPFCGGAGIAFKLLFDHSVDAIVLNDYDIAIYSIWNAAIFESEKFISRIKDTKVDLEEWERQRQIYKKLKNENKYNFDLGFAAFFLNRTNHSGILKGGPIGGIHQKSKYRLDCRYNKESLIKKVEDMVAFRNKILLFHMDGLNFIQDVIRKEDQSNLFIFFDPPYIGQGKILYKNNLTMDNHKKLAEAIQNVYGNWITTYDVDWNIFQQYSAARRFKYKLNYSASIKRNQYELLFSNPKTKVESYGNVILEPFD
jgi:DNA adenine methylase